MALLDKLKGIGSQVASKASDAVEGISTSVRGGVESLTSTAINVSEAVNEKAVRASTAQVCSILEIALKELEGRSLSAKPVTLTASVNIGVASLEMQVHVPAMTPQLGSGTDCNEGDKGA
jgi:hypothetical protein